MANDKYFLNKQIIQIAYLQIKQFLIENSQLFNFIFLLVYCKNLIVL